MMTGKFNGAARDASKGADLVRGAGTTGPAGLGYAASQHRTQQVFAGANFWACFLVLYASCARNWGQVLKMRQRQSTSEGVGSELRRPNSMCRKGRVFTAFDKTLSKQGRIALWTKGDSVTRFDSIAINVLSPSEERY